MIPAITLLKENVYPFLQTNIRLCNVSSFIRLRLSPCVSPLLLNKRSTPADDAGKARNCLAIFPRYGNIDLCILHQSRTSSSRSELKSTWGIAMYNSTSLVSTSTELFVVDASSLSMKSSSSSSNPTTQKIINFKYT
jgi:hypothetical protein